MNSDSEIFGSSLSAVYGSDFGTSTTHANDVILENQNDHVPISSKVIGGDTRYDDSDDDPRGESHNDGLTNSYTRTSNLTQKIMEYRLHLEQINNEHNYVTTQLNIFNKQLDSITGGDHHSKGVDHNLNVGHRGFDSNRVEPDQYFQKSHSESDHPPGTNADLQKGPFTVEQTYLNDPRSRYPNQLGPGTKLLHNIGLFFKTKDPVKDDLYGQTDGLNILFALLLIIIGWHLAKMTIPRSL